VDSGINSPASNDEELWKRVAHIGARAHQYDAANMPLNIPAPVPVSFVVLQSESSRFCMAAVGAELKHSYKATEIHKTHIGSTIAYYIYK